MFESSVNYVGEFRTGMLNYYGLIAQENNRAHSFSTRDPRKRDHYGIISIGS